METPTLVEMYPEYFSFMQRKRKEKEKEYKTPSFKRAGEEFLKVLQLHSKQRELC